jgi:hypothetical protein
MSGADALKAAIDMLHIPSQVRVARVSPLPKGVSLLLRLAAGDPEANDEAESLSGRPASVCRKAAVFFIEQILLAPEADNYRILGSDKTASGDELRSHMALLLKWLHPDLSRDSHKSLLARRVVAAWELLKTPERRRHHDDVHQSQEHHGTARGAPNPLESGARPTRSRAPSFMRDRQGGGASRRGERLKDVFGFLRRLAGADRDA